MTAVSVGWDTDLSELEFRATRGPADIEDDDGVVIGPPARSAPGLDNFSRGIQHQVYALDMRSSRCELATHLLADPRVLPERDWYFFESMIVS